MITRNTTIEDLVEDYPKSVKYLADKGIRCIKCGEPIWGTLEEACLEKGFTQDAIDNAVNDLNTLHDKGSDHTNPDKLLNIKTIKKSK